MTEQNNDRLSAYLSTIKFKRQLIGGVDEEDVWAVISRLHKEYQAMSEVNEACYVALLEDRDKQLQRQQEEICQLKARLGVQKGFME